MAFVYVMRIFIVCDLRNFSVAERTRVARGSKLGVAKLEALLRSKALAKYVVTCTFLEDFLVLPLVSVMCAAGYVDNSTTCVGWVIIRTEPEYHARLICLPAKENIILLTCASNCILFHWRQNLVRLDKLS